VWVTRISIKGKLKHFRPRNTELVAQCANVRRDHPEILGDEWQTTYFSLDRFEKLGPWAGYPASSPRRFCVGRHVPGSSESAEMIQADYVHMSQERE
jgi:hypothetical protein